MTNTKKDRLSIGHLSTVYHTNFILMGSKTFKKEINRDVDWILFGTGPEMVQAFKEKKIEIGYMGLPPAIIGIDQGVPIKCVAGGHVEGTIMIAKKKYKDIKSLGDDIYCVLSQFKGKSIGVTSKGSIHDVILNYYLKNTNLTEEINVKNYAQAEFIAIDLKKGIIEAGVGTPALAVFASSILDSHIIISPEYLRKNNPSYGIFFHEKFIKESPEIVKIFLVHHKNASFLLRNNISKAVNKICMNFKILNKKYVKAVLEISPKYCIALSDEYVKSTMDFVSSLYNLGYIKKILKINEVFEFSLVNQIHPEKEHYNL
ncbi:MAG: ABC transporter substrate-binding protein [Promethearchaeota archaeon]